TGSAAGQSIGDRHSSRLTEPNGSPAPRGSRVTEASTIRGTHTMGVGWPTGSSATVVWAWHGAPAGDGRQRRPTSRVWGAMGKPTAGLLGDNGGNHARTRAIRSGPHVRAPAHLPQEQRR